LFLNYADLRGGYTYFC